MTSETLFAAGATAVITGAASGIGRAAAIRLAEAGMSLVLFDRDEAPLAELAGTLPGAKYLAGDVREIGDVERLRDLAYDAFGTVTVLMNNAAIGGEGSDNWAGIDAWRRIIDVNLWGVVNGVHVFAPAMLAQGAHGAIVNTGSKQGITNPPGFPAYAVAKAGVRTLTEQLEHGLREAGGAISAHLLVPGWTWTGMTRHGASEKPAGAWTAEQVVDRMIAGIDAGDFYIICPDNAVSSELDAARVLWGAGDLAENRPALSRWHPDWKEPFEAFVAERLA
jgi:NAD(P)-dependent dehydrogenase (short-subunit alcohol dehydrogenase family)